MGAFLQGLTLGAVYVMPIGAQNIFVINTALTQKRSRTLLTAFIVFIFDVILSIGCFFGIGAIMQTSPWIELSVLGLGSFIVIWIGFSIFRDKSAMDDNGNNTNTDISLSKIITTACVVTWFNPQALIDGSMMLGAFRSSLPGQAGTLFITGVCTASFLWWFGMSSFVSLFKSKMSNKVLRGINIVCGTIIMGYGVKLLISFVQMAANVF